MVNKACSFPFPCFVFLPAFVALFQKPQILDSKGMVVSPLCVRIRVCLVFSVITFSSRFLTRGLHLQRAPAWQWVLLRAPCLPQLRTSAVVGSGSIFPSSKQGLQSIVWFYWSQKGTAQELLSGGNVRLLG